MKKMKYLVLDCETATLPFVDEICHTSTDKKTIAIAKPLIYDIGWVIVDRKGNIEKQESFLVAETFSVPSVFNTAYYKEKRPIYINKLNNGEITIKPWKEIVTILINDMNESSMVGAFNSMFDFKKAIPFTDLYINKLYSDNYYEWEQRQIAHCKEIISGRTNKDSEFENDIFRFHGNEYPLFDLWGLAVEHLINNQNYKKMCLFNDGLTNSGLYFKTSAEMVYRYIQKDNDFIEAHTAIEDALIESEILSRIAKKHGITTGIKYFPFKDLGYTYDFIQRNKKVNVNEYNVVYNVIKNYADNHIGNYIIYIISVLNNLEELMREA